jgi:signal transduction histidine kinase
MSATNKPLISPDSLSSSVGSSRDKYHHPHVVQFYSNDAPLLDALCRYIGSALAAGDSAIVIATKAHRDSLASLLLNSRGLDTSTAAKQGRYIPLDAEETLSKFMIEGWPDPALFGALVAGLVTRAKAAAKGENPRVFGFGEMVSLLWAQGKYEAAIQLEGLWNDAIEKHSFTVRCAYPIAGFDREEHAEQFLKICAGHSAVIPGESYTDLISEDERFRDISNLQRKAHALETEIVERRKAEQALKLAHDELETRVMERTAEINEKNAQMRRQGEILATTNQGLRALSARLFQVLDEERRRIARDLHDSTGQALALLSMNLSVLELEASPNNPDLAKALSDNGMIVRQISTELRTLSYLLHPPLLDEMGLQSALRWYVEGFGQRSNIKVNLELPDDLGRLSREMEIALFRITQECLTNIHRHSESETAFVQLCGSDGRIALAIKDEGKGLAPDKLINIASLGGFGVGIRGMQERVKNLGGELEIRSDATGTEIKVVIPIPSPE